MELMLQPLRKYADFNGRARRSEFWLFQLFVWGVIVGVYVVASIVSAIFIQPTAVGPDANVEDPAVAAAGVVSVLLFGALVIFFLAMVIPGLAVRVRRLHDIGLSGWMILLGLIPGVGGLILLVMSLIDGNAHPNEHGPDPKGRGQQSIAETFT